MEVHPELSKLIKEKRNTAEDDLIGYEILEVVLGSPQRGTVNYAGLHSDLMHQPGIGLPTTFRGAVLSRATLHGLLVPWVNKWENFLYLVGHLRTKYRLLGHHLSFLDTLLVAETSSLNPDTWKKGGNNLVMFERRLDVLYSVVAACLDGSAMLAVYPQRLDDAIAALGRPLEHSLNKSRRYQVTARYPRDGPF
ncbi:hypothetical protein JCM3765_004132 [Sporobolomyces pararoseus]